ncbi:MAG TPA: flagellar basal body L-ring protein FlgH [Vitreimonas sp.]|nr:flagellar basal body L-ring protein FlgH [Vitreimonas sp.]
MRGLALLALAIGASGCATAPNVGVMAQDTLAAPGAAYNAARRAFGPPQMNPVGNPAPLTGGQQQTMPMPPEPTSYEPAGPNSLWRAGSRSFFNDQRASRVGDILTVNIEIDDKAELSNQSSRQRSSSTDAGVTHFFGLEQTAGRLFGNGFDPEHMVGGAGTSDQSGQGAINRKEKIQLTVAAVIVDRLPNGNLVIAGRQDVMINAELRQLTISGVVRPEDISPDNTINHTQIAEARISYGGQGQLSAVQRPSWGQRIADAISPW